MNIIDRIKQIIEYKGISTRKFCIEIGVANGFFDKVKDVGSGKVLKILETYPDISANWLLTGKGDMLSEPYSEYFKKEDWKDKYIDVLEENRRLQNEIAELKREKKDKKSFMVVS